MDEVGEWQEESSLSEGGWGHMGLAAHNETEARACRQVLIHTANNEHSIFYTDN